MLLGLMRPWVIKWSCNSSIPDITYYAMLSISSYAKYPPEFYNSSRMAYKLLGANSDTKCTVLFYNVILYGNNRFSCLILADFFINYYRCTKLIFYTHLTVT